MVDFYADPISKFYGGPCSREEAWALVPDHHGQGYPYRHLPPASLLTTWSAS
jgi:hypothetical protein